MKIEVGKYYRTSTSRIIGPLIRSGNYFVSPNMMRSWGRDGRSVDSLDDIVNEVRVEDVKPKSFEFWVNVYRDGLNNEIGWSYQTKEEADKAATPKRIACILVKGTKGEGL